MTRCNQAIIAAASSLALFGGALSLITPAPAAAFDRRAFGQALMQAGQDFDRQMQQDARDDWARLDRQWERMQDRRRSCSTSFIGNTAYTNCY